MAPHLPRPSLNGVQAILSSTSSRIAVSAVSRPNLVSSTSWATVSLQRRALASSPPLASTHVPPESPRFMSVPEPPQSKTIDLPRVRGHLPVPRKIFPKRGGAAMADPQYIPRTMPLSKAEAAGRPPGSAEQARARVDAASRRRALAEGLQGLWKRKVTKERWVRAQKQAKAAANRQAAMAPDALDDVLTRGTVRASTALVTEVLPDPERFAKAEVARARHAEILAGKAEARRDALAQLYVAAGNFIVDEAELEEQINRLFSEDHFKYDATQPGENIWSTGQLPISVTETRLNATQEGAMVSNKSSSTMTSERQKKVAEELTGGKL